jgi:transcriptional regulator with XRE-family HTH domain
MDSLSLSQRLGQTLRARREALGYSQDRFADRIDMHRAYFAAIERGEKNITLSTLQRLAAGLSTRMSALLEESGL